MPRQALRRTGMTTTTLQIEGMTCSACIQHVSDALALDGVSRVNVRLAESSAVVEHESSITGYESGTMRSDPGDLFAAASGGGRAQASASSHDDDGDLFGSKPAASKSSGGAGDSGSKLRALIAALRGAGYEASIQLDAHRAPKAAGCCCGPRSSR